MPEPILVEQRDAVATVTVNRPEVLNALTAETLDALDRVIGALTGDRRVRCVVLTGAGTRAFVAGADVSELTGLDADRAARLARRGQRLFDRLERLGTPVIAAINGVALGGGCELAMACTLRWAADTAVLGLPEVGLGLIPGFGGTQRLSRLVGRGRALELIVRGRRVTADEALRIGLVHQVVAADELLDRVADLAAELARGAPLAQRHAIAAVTEGADLPFGAASDVEATLFGLTASTADAHEGTRAFLEKRPARFEGR